MLQQISYLMILGHPLILYLGIITLALFLVAASIPLLRKHHVLSVPFEWHPRIAGIAIALGLIHGALGLLAYL